MDGRPLTTFSTLGVPATFDGGMATEVAPNGEFVLVWGAAVNQAELLSVRLFDRRGLPITGALGVAQALPGAPGFSQVRVRRHRNDFLLSWTLLQQDGSFDFYLSELSTSSRQLGPPTLIAHSYDLPQPSGSNNISADGYDLEMNDSGRGVVTWSTFDENHVFTGHLRLITVVLARGGQAQSIQW